MSTSLVEVSIPGVVFVCCSFFRKSRTFIIRQLWSWKGSACSNSTVVFTAISWTSEASCSSWPGGGTLPGWIVNGPGDECPTCPHMFVEKGGYQGTRRREVCDPKWGSKLWRWGHLKFHPMWNLRTCQCTGME